MKALSITLSRLGFLVHKGSLAVLDQCLFAGTNFLVNILLARWLSPEHYGAFVLAFSIFLFLSGFHNALILDPMSVLGPVHYKDCSREYLSSLLWIHAGLTLGLAIFLVSAAAVFLLVTENLPMGSALMGLGFSTPFILLLYLFRRAFYLQHRPKGALEINLIYSVCVIIGLILLDRISIVSSFSALLLTGLASLLASGLACHRLKPRFRKEYAALVFDLKRILGENWRYGKWLVAVTFVQWLSGNIYYVFTAGFLGLEETGTLRALQNFVLPLGHVMTAVQLVLMPWAAKHLAEQGLVPFKRSIVEITSLMTALAGAYALILAFSAAPLMQVLYDGKYQGFVWLVPWFAVSFLTTSFAGGYGLGLKVAQATRAIFVVTCIGAGTTIFVGSILVRLLGLEGVALGALLSNTSEALVIVWCWRRLVWQKSSELNRYNPRSYTLDKGTKHGSHSI